MSTLVSKSHRKRSEQTPACVASPWKAVESICNLAVRVRCSERIANVWITCICVTVPGRIVVSLADRMATEISAPGADRIYTLCKLWYFGSNSVPASDPSLLRSGQGNICCCDRVLTQSHTTAHGDLCRSNCLPLDRAR